MVTQLRRIKEKISLFCCLSQKDGRGSIRLSAGGGFKFTEFLFVLLRTWMGKCSAGDLSPKMSFFFVGRFSFMNFHG